MVIQETNSNDKTETNKALGLNLQPIQAECSKKK